MNWIKEKWDKFINWLIRFGKRVYGMGFWELAEKANDELKPEFTELIAKFKEKFPYVDEAEIMKVIDDAYWMGINKIADKIGVPEKK